MSTFCTQGDGASAATATATAGVTAALVGFAGSLAIVLAGLRGGRRPRAGLVGLLALSVAMGATGIVLSALTRMPLSIAWSKPRRGAADRQRRRPRGLAAGLAMVGLERLRR